MFVCVDCIFPSFFVPFLLSNRDLCCNFFQINLNISLSSVDLFTFSARDILTFLAIIFIVLFLLLPPTPHPFYIFVYPHLVNLFHPSDHYFYPHCYKYGSISYKIEKKEKKKANQEQTLQPVQHMRKVTCVTNIENKQPQTDNV